MLRKVEQGWTRDRKNKFVESGGVLRYWNKSEEGKNGSGCRRSKTLAAEGKPLADQNARKIKGKRGIRKEEQRKKTQGRQGKDLPSC